MKPVLLISHVLILIASACVDRLSYEIKKTANQSISITGYISDLPGPYEIRVYSTFDIESIESTKTPLYVKSMEISDNRGTLETLTALDAGIYRTKSTGIRGVVGGVYKLRIELLDGRIYESLPDTILPTGSLDSLYLRYTDEYTETGGKKCGVDVFFDATYNPTIGNQFVWKFNGTFQAETQPENYSGQNCFFTNDISRCNFVPPCSGYRNIGTNVNRVFEQKYNCTCCQCWYSLFNDYVILSDNQFTNKGILKGVWAQNVPLNQWTLLHKIRVEMSQLSLSNNSFRFWKAVKRQKESIGNLFQPVSGKIPTNFIQIAGASTRIEGLFYATAISNKVQYIERFDLPPNLRYQISFEKPVFTDDCRLLFPNSTTIRPAFWED